MKRTSLQSVYMINLGRAIRSLRSKLRLSQEQLAEQANLHRTYIGAVERGERNITIVSLHRIAVVLGVSAATILRRAESLTKRQTGGAP